MLILDEDGNELLLPKTEQIPSDFFKKGDTLRVTIELWAGSSTSRIYWTMAFDPQDRAVATYDTTQLKVYVPFVLDL